MLVTQEYANYNRELIATAICRILGIPYVVGRGFHTVHNYFDHEDNTIRKGAIRADKGQIVIIPLNMRDGSLLCRGLGNKEWLNSAPHGAGRCYSRSKAKENLSLDQYMDDMKDVFTTSAVLNTLDEAPRAYKDSDAIRESMEGKTVEVIATLKSVYNFKSTSSGKKKK